jgi:hypothetical protein
MSDFTFTQFGRTWVVVGPADAIETALKLKAPVKVPTAKDPDRMVTPASLYVTKAGKTSWTYKGTEQAAFVPVDDRPKAEPKAKADTKAKAKAEAAPVTPSAPAVDIDAIVAAAVAQAVAAALAAVQGAPAPDPVAPAPAPARSVLKADEACDCCGAEGPLTSHRGAKHLKVCGKCKSLDADTAVARNTKRLAKV